ncbi:FtsX-like permease family protein [Mucilaginibacter sp. RCC_168]|uniref:ABC transporter permease n=1 Tax=Mucilaginibacter sp. RCC_168 TaxID=3239221 RepID=UPI0035262FFA
MIKHHFKIAFRVFWKHKLFTLVNIFGLSIGISAFLVIYMVVHYDFTFDKFHNDSDRIYRVVMDISSQGQKKHSSGVPVPLAKAVKEQSTGIQATVPLLTLSPDFVYVEGNKNARRRFKGGARITLTDQQYFKIFNYTWLAGSSQHALDAPNQVVLTSKQAMLYFPSLPFQDIIGKIVTYDTLSTTVSGIVQTPAKNTDFAFHDFISFGTATTNKPLAAGLKIDTWNSIFSGSQLFVKLMPGVSATGVVKQISIIYRKSNPPQSAKQELTNTTNLILQRLDDIHFNRDYSIFDFSSPTSKTTLYGLLTIAGFLLSLACINYINLTTAQASQRANEIGIRKSMGCSRLQLIVQFLSETFFITFFAVIISMLLALGILKLFADFIPPGIHADLLYQEDVIMFLPILAIAVSVLAGFYPAILLSSYKPISVLKNQVRSESGKTRNGWLRKSLTVSQFIVGLFFLMATILVSKQIYYVLHKDLGFKKDAILIIRTPKNINMVSRNKILLNDFRLMPQITLVSLGDEPPSSFTYNRMRGVYDDGKKQIITEEVICEAGDENFIKLYQIKLLAGRNIQESDSGKAIIVNNTYAKALGFVNPYDAIGKQLTGFSGSGKSVNIIGVVADYNQRSLHSPIYPSAILWPQRKIDMRTIHVGLKPATAGGNEWKTAIAEMGKTWKKVYPDDDFDCQFYDETIAKFYDEEQQASTLLRWATGFSILISCLGLLGLAVYTMNQRKKEIGIRKAFGATVAQIVILLSTELILLILLAFIIVTPIAWYAMHHWLENFADHTAISWWIFVLSGMGMVLVAILTSGFETAKAALANPTKSLRSE